VRDVARVELGAQAYSWYVQLNGDPSIGIAVYQLPGANALQVAEGIRAAMSELATRFPDGLEYTIAYDSTRSINASIQEVVETLFIAILLVIFTVYIFLQDFRTTLVPSVTIPVSLLGTFAVMMALGLSINTLTLFGLVLAIGIVVDDAIVVVENTMRLIDEEGLGAKEATAKAMEQVTGPVVATTLVLLAVFVPVTMMGGITGRLYAQFATTIATATVFSSINALTLSPALCGMLLRPSPEKRGWFFTQFNKWFDRSTNAYMGMVKVLVRRSAFVMLLFIGVLVLGYFGFVNVPGGFLPDEDKGYFFANVKLPDAASLERTEEVLDVVTDVLMEAPGVVDVITIGGYSMLDSLQSSNAGAAIAVLSDWSERPSPEEHALAVSAALNRQLAQIQEGTAFTFIPPPIDGLGNAGGFEFILQDRGGAGYQQLQTIGDDLVAAGNQHPVLTRMNNSFRANVPQLYLEIDRTKVKSLGIPLSEVFNALQAYLGSAYVNDFNLFGRTYRVMLQADADFRSQVEQISQLEVRDAAGRMIPMATLLTVQDTVGPQAVTRYNLYPAATITGSPRPGYSSGQAQQAMEQLAAELLPPSMGYEWTGTTYQQIVAGNQAPIIFTLAFIFVFLFLAAQYESWLIPIAVVLAIPFSLIGAMYGTLLRSYDNNIYTQIGLVLLIGLSAKVAILIVEFAKQLREEGKSIIEAAEIAAHQRFRPLLMTAFSFILGVIPLLIASGAGSGSRRSLGTAVFFGMLISTVLGVVFIPVFYVFVQKMRELRSKEPAADGDEAGGGGRPTGPPKPESPPGATTPPGDAAPAADPSPPTDTQPLGEVS
jgi:HAE1 family hydrophobic/amphiphilic exporter-1